MNILFVVFASKFTFRLILLDCSSKKFFLIITRKLLLSLTVQYFQGEESVGERSTCIVMGFVYLLISMVVLIINENVLELGLETAYKTFNESASAFLTTQGLNSSYVGFF